MKDKIKQFYKSLPEKKGHVEFITAILTIPVLLTVIFNNVDAINGKKTAGSEQAKQTVTVVPVEVREKTAEPKPSNAAEQCKKEVGPVSIASPKEEEAITGDPVTIDIDYQTGEYCAVAWQYRINGGNWSGYTDKSISLYNLSPGEKTLEVRVKSIASGDEKLLTRKFSHVNDTTPTPTASDAAALK